MAIQTPPRDWLRQRIPAPLLPHAEHGEYLRLHPYPVQEIVGRFVSQPFVDRGTRIVTIGSCFAQELARWLDGNGYQRLPHHWGVVYNPLSIRQIAEWSVDPKSWQPAERYWTNGNGYHDPYRKADDHGGPMFLGSDELSARRALEQHYQDSRATFREADLAVLTLGLTELWRHRQDRKAFYAVPGPDFFQPHVHEFQDLSHAEVVEHGRAAITMLRRINPRLRFLLAVSPIPLSISFRAGLGPYVATQFSKSILHAAVYQLVQELDGVDYMPSYEIANSNPSVHFGEDGRHVTPHCVETIMRSFECLYVAGASACRTRPPAGTGQSCKL